MLAYILAIAIAIYSLILFALAFFSPVIHRKDDFLWSGIGLFYALVLWLCAGRITGAVLLGQSAVTILVLSFGWQTFKLRKAIAYPDQQWEEFSVMEWVQSRIGSIGRKKPTIPPPAAPADEAVIPPQPESESPEITVTEDQTTETLAQDIIETATQENIEEPIGTDIKTEEETLLNPLTEVEATNTEEQTSKSLTDFPEKATVETTSTEPPQSKTRQKKGFSLKICLEGAKKPTPQPTPESVNKAIEQADLEEDQWDIPEQDSSPTPQNTQPLPMPENKEESNLSQTTTDDSLDYQMETFIADEGAETVIESYRSPEMLPDDSLDYQMETFIADEGAETVIESYRPDLTSSETKAKKDTTNKPDESKETETEAKNEIDKAE